MLYSFTGFDNCLISQIQLSQYPKEWFQCPKTPLRSICLPVYSPPKTLGITDLCVILPLKEYYIAELHMFSSYLFMVDSSFLFIAN